MNFLLRFLCSLFLSEELAPYALISGIPKGEQFHLDSDQSVEDLQPQLTLFMAREPHSKRTGQINQQMQEQDLQIQLIPG